MTIDTTVSLAHIFTWALFIGSLISVGAWVKMKIQSHESVIYDGNGNVRLVSHDDLRRKEIECERTRRIQDSMSISQVENLTAVIIELQKEIKQLSRCVTILAAGGSSEGC